MGCSVRKRTNTVHIKSRIATYEGSLQGMAGIATATPSETTSVPHGTDEERKGPPKPQLEGEAKLRRFLRGYVAAQLRRKGHCDLAVIVERETKRLMPSSLDEDEVAEVLTRMADKLNEERSEQFEHMCVQLNLSQTNTRRKFNKVMTNLFQENIMWGNIVTLVTFTGHIATYCARYNMDEQSIEVLNEADTYVRTCMSNSCHGYWSKVAG